MNIPPAILHLAIASSDHAPVRLWLPLFLLWPLLLVLVILALVVAIAVDLILILAGRRYHHYTRLLVGSLDVMCKTRGLVVRVNDSKATVDMTVL
jgi:hypothetical protein